MTTTTETQTLYFCTLNGKVVSYGPEDRKEAQWYVNRNNAAAKRRGDDSKPYAVVSYVVPA